MARLAEASITPLKRKTDKELSGVFTEIDVFNQNERRYPNDVYMEAYDELKPKIEGRRLMGELDHPIDYDEIRLSNVSHVIIESHVETINGIKTIVGTVELLDTPAGKIAQALVSAGINLGISSRGVGNTRKVSGGVDVTQLKLITYDLVADPSFKSAVLTPDQRNELSESLNAIEAKLPMNESIGDNSIREKIHSIRESLCSDNSRVESNINRENVQNLEIKSLKSLLESSSRTVKNDTVLLKKQRNMIKDYASRIKKLEESLKVANSRYTTVYERHSKLQESYNAIEEESRLHESKELAKKDAEIIELKKRLAVERRGISYARVENLLEGLQNEVEIEDRLDSLSSISRKSVHASEVKESIRESALTPAPTRSKLSSVVSRV